MRQGKVRHLLRLAAALVAGAVLIGERSSSEASTTLQALAERTHFHGIAVDPGDPSRLYLATHHGLYAVTLEGDASRISESSDDFMGFSAHPTDPSAFYASGHPPGGGNLGVISSSDGGRTWTRLADGVNGPVDFHQMDVSPADPNTIYGAYAGDLQVSRDGGQSWEIVGAAPEDLTDLAASGRDPGVLYAATRRGLLRSEDGGRSWHDAYFVRRPATMVRVAAPGNVYAYLVGTGLIRASEADLSWQTVKDPLDQEYVLHLAVDPSDDARLYAVTLHPETHAQRILASRDAGQSWSALGAQ